jgi:hypothetical protein
VWPMRCLLISMGLRYTGGIVGSWSHVAGSGSLYSLLNLKMLHCIAHILLYHVVPVSRSRFTWYKGYFDIWEDLIQDAYSTVYRGRYVPLVVVNHRVTYTPPRMLGPYLHIKLTDDSMIMKMRLIRAIIASFDQEVLVEDVAAREVLVPSGSITNILLTSVPSSCLQVK